MRRANVGRVAIWITNTISGAILVVGVMFIGLAGESYGASSSCASAVDQPPCTPVLSSVTINTTPSPFLRVTLGFLAVAVLVGLAGWIFAPILAARRGKTERVPILIVSLFAVAFAAFVLAVPMLVLPKRIAHAWIAPVLATPETCLNYSGPGAVCFHGAGATLAAIIGIGLPVLLMAFLISVPVWVMALVETGRAHRWGWFAAILLLSPYAAIAYGVLGGRGQSPSAPVTPATTAA